MKRACAVAGLLGLLWATPAFADEAEDVGRLLKSGQLTEAVNKADAFLAQKPRDLPMRFLKGVILTEMNRQTEAISVFAKLTEEFPERPEPHNNLAVLYAAGGQYDKARASLDMAIRTNPAYATAYENLGDVHAKLASQAYDKALQLDSGNSAAKSKLTLLRTLGGAAGTPGAARSAPQVAAKSAAPTPAASAQAPAPAPAPVPVAVAQAPKAAPVQEVPAASAPAAAKSAQVVDGQEDEVLKVVNGWATAWSARDVKAYLDYYGQDFQTPGGVSRKTWAEERQSRIQGKGRIAVSIESPRVVINGTTATVTFRQAYVSDRMKANSRKTLVLSKQGGKWQIKQERTAS